MGQISAGYVERIRTCLRQIDDHIEKHDAKKKDAVLLQPRFVTALQNHDT